MNNLETLKALSEEIESRAKENERIINEITQKHLQNWEQVLTAMFIQKLDFIEQQLQKKIAKFDKVLTNYEKKLNELKQSKTNGNRK
ncbi:hypothetical protein T36_2227 (plasmid) [Helicobacter cinaedi]|uniref:hypothetical protein n=1 Tax=Helicobacter cinaedi TaxID=213 RepID=UPI001F1D6256|nr:hypothetical protein [Helicobacter cinaedi]BDB65748.1 hypothetical protein T36_2227 [Helicobacter cinaedi]